MIIFIDPCLPIFFSEEAVNVTKLGYVGEVAAAFECVTSA